MKIKNDLIKLNIQLFADGEISYKVSIDGKEAEKTINTLSKSSDGLSKKFTSFGAKMTVGVTAPLTALATAGVKYNASMETYLANLTTLLGGNEQAAQKLLDTLKEMANTTPYEATDLVKATQKMMAFGISADDSLKYLNMLGDVAMGDANKMDSLTLAFSQISASGRASMEDINQMIDQGFNPLTIIAQKTGESMGDLRDRVSEGGVSFEEIAGAFETATSKGGTFYQSMDKASQTTEGKISTLKDGFNTALGSMTESLLPFVTEAVEGLTKVADWFANLDENGKRTVLTLAGIAVAIGPVSTAIGGLIKIGSGIKTLVTTIKSWASVTKIMTTVQAALNAVMAINPITLIIIAIVALIAIIVVLWTKCEWFRTAVMTAINAIWSVIQSVAQFIMNIFTTVLNVVSSIFNAIWIVVQTVFSFIWTIVQNYVSFWITVWSTIFNVVSTVLTTIWNTIQSVFNFIWGIISGVINSIISAFRNVANIVKSVFTSVKNAISNLFSGVVNIIKAPINGLIGLINGVIKGLNKIKMPDWVPAIGGKGINIPLIPKLATGTNYVAGEGLAYLHEGEAVVPKKYNPAIGGYGNYNQPVYVNVVADMDVNKFGKAFVRDIKTFSGGTKNSYNYGGGK
ncbi:phage tail tape measure protein [uncultured Megamonas sp.]|uniref:phage tail tape measure protein n=1 Tax=uncultured Megamonas sp. TaxID=286140 RepID=UPI00259B92C2|nr:phage tail tape measure protein [uncultured Megamonas sp.]